MILGLGSDITDARRIAKVIEQEFGVSYHKGHVARLLKDLCSTARTGVFWMDRYFSDTLFHRFLASGR